MRKTGLLVGCFALIFWTPTKGLGSESQRSFFSESPFGNILLHRSSSAREEDQRPLASRQTTHIPALSTGYRKTFKANSVAPGNHRELLQPPGEDQVLGRYFSNRLSHSALVDLDSLLNVSQDVLTEALNLANFTSRQYDRDFGGVTPRKDFDELDQLIDQIQVSSEILKNSTTSLRDLPRQLKQLSTQLHSIFEKFYGLVNLTNNSKAFSGVCHKIVTSAYIIDRCYEKLRQISLKISIFAKKMSQEALLAHVLMKNYAEKDLEEVFLFEQLREILFELCRIQNRIIILLKRQSHVSLQLNEEVELLQENYEQFRLILNGSKGQINKRISLISNLMEKINNISVVSLDLLDIKNYHFHNKSKEDFPHLENKLFLGEKMNSSLCGQSSLKIPICAKPSLLKCIGKECATIPSEKEYDINLKAHESDGVKRPPGLIVPTLLDQVAESTSKKTMDFNNELHLTKAIDQVTFVHLTTRENQTGSITPRPNMDFYYSSTRYNEYPGVKHGSTKNPQLDLDEYPYPKLNYPQIHKDRAKDSKFDADRTLPQLSKTTSHFVTPNITVNFAESIDEISTQSPKSYLFYKELVSGDNNFTFAPTQVLDHAKHLAGSTSSPLVNQQQESTSRQKIELKTEPSLPKMIDLVTLLTTTTNTTVSITPRPNIDFYYSSTRYSEYPGVKHGSTKNPQLALDEHPYPKLNYPQIHEDSQEDSKFDADMTLPQLSKTTSKLATPNITVNFAESIDDISTQLPKSYLHYKELVSGDNNFTFAPTHALDHAMHLAGSTPSPLVNQQQESTSRQKIDLKTEPSPPKMVDLVTLLTTSTNPTGSITPRPNIDFYYSPTRYDEYPSVKHGSTINPQLAIDEHPYPKLNYPQVHKDVAEDSKFDADRTLPQFGKTTSHFAVPNITVNFEESIDDISTQSSKSYLYYKELVSGDDNFVFAPTHVLDHTKHLAGSTPSPLVNQEQESTSRQKIDLKTEPSPPKIIDIVTLLTTTTNATGSITPRPNIDFYYSSTRYKEYPGVKHGSTKNPQLALDEQPYPKLNYPQIHKDRAEDSKFDADRTLPQLSKTTSHFVTPNITVNFAESIDDISTQLPKSYLYYKELVSGDNNFTFAPIHVLDHAMHLAGSTPSPLVNQQQESTSRQKIDLKTEPSPPKMVDLVTLLTTSTNPTGSITPRPNIDFYYSPTRYDEYPSVKHGSTINSQLAIDEHPYPKLNYPQIHKDRAEDSKFDADRTLPQFGKTTSHFAVPNITVKFEESIDDISTQSPKSYLYYKELVSGDNNFLFAPTHVLDHTKHLTGSTPSPLVNQEQESTSRQKIDLKTEPSPPKMIDLVTLLTTTTNTTVSITPRPNIDFYYSPTRYNEYPGVKHGSTKNPQLALDEHSYPKLNYAQIHNDRAEDSKFDADGTLPQLRKTTSHFVTPNITVNFTESIAEISTQSHVLDHAKHLAGSTPSPLVNQEQQSTSRQKIDLKTEPSPPKIIDRVTLLTTTTNTTGSITPRPNVDFYYSSTQYNEYLGVKHGSTINPQLAIDEHPYPKLNYPQIHKDRAEDSTFDVNRTRPQLSQTTSHFVTSNITVNFAESINDISTQSQKSYPYYNKSVYGDNNFVFVPTHDLNHAKQPPGLRLPTLVDPEAEITSMKTIDLNTKLSPPKKIDLVTLLTTTTNPISSITPRSNIDFYFSNRYHNYPGDMQGSTISTQLGLDKHSYPKNNDSQIHKDTTEDFTFATNKTLPKLNKSTRYFITSNITVNFEVSTQSPKLYSYYNESVSGYNNRTIPKLNKSTSHFVTSNITVNFEESTNQISTKLQNVYPNYPDSVLGDKDFKFIPTTHATVTQTSNYTVVNETNKISDQINVHIHPSQKDDSFTSSTSNVTQSNAMVQTTLPPDIHPKLDSNRQTNLNDQSSDWLIKDLSPKEAGPGNLSIFPMRGRGYLNTPTNVSSVDKATHSLPSNVSTVNVYFTTNISIIKSTNSPKEIKDGSASNLKENSTKVSTDPTMVNGSISIFNLQYQMLPTNNSSPIENSSISELPLDSTANPFTASTLPKPRQKEKFMPVQFIPRENNHENTTNFESIGSRIFVPHFHGTSDTSIQINNTIYKTKMFNLWSSWKSKEITTLHSLLLSPPQTKEDLNITPEEEEEIIEESEMDYNYDSKDDYKDFESYRKYAKKFSMEHLVNLDIQDILELDLTSTTTLEPLQDQYTTMLDLMTPEEEELPKYDSVSYQTTSGNEDCDKTEAVLGTCKIIMYHHKRPTESDWNLSLICPCTMPSYEGTCPKKIQKGTEYIINICRVAVSA